MPLHRVTLRDGADLDGFRHSARALVADGVAPDRVFWEIGAAPGLFGGNAGDLPPAHVAPQGNSEPSPLRLPRAMADLIAEVVPNRDPERYALLYALIWRVLHGERGLPEVASDPVVHRLGLLARAVRRDIHKMHAFLRFRRVEEEPERFMAWFEPEHFILEAAAPFFVERFRALAWSILTPIGSAYWDRTTLAFGPPAERGEAPDHDAVEDGWRTYYESVFNPARVNPRAMRAEMPQKYWRNMPEAAAIPRLIQTASSRVTEMIAQEATMPTKRTPDAALRAMKEAGPQSLEELNAIIRASEPLVPGATQAVLGEGPVGAEIAFVGEQPGDQEDLQGRPFIGPAGQLLSRAMGEVGIDRGRVYVTNAVKHFKFEKRGQRRIHSKPTASDVSHYRPWLTKELDLVRPKLVVALGATAVLALTGKAISVMRARGRARFGEFDGYVTVHPSYLLRVPEEAAKRQAYDDFLTDLARIRDLAQAQAAAVQGTQGSQPSQGLLPLGME